MWGEGSSVFPGYYFGNDSGGKTRTMIALKARDGKKHFYTIARNTQINIKFVFIRKF